MSMYKVICVTNRTLVSGGFLTQMQKVLEAGVSEVILREKDLDEQEYEKLASEVKNLCERYATPLKLHTHIQAARRLGCSIHLPYQTFLSMGEEEKGEFEKIGVSVHAVEEAVRAEAAGAACLTAGHIFATDCKKGVPPRGLDFLRETCGAVRIPVYAIGGITPENAKDCVQAGAAGICLMSSLMQRNDPKELLKK